MMQILQKILMKLLPRKVCFSVIAFVQVTLMLIAPLHIVDAGVRASVQKALRNFARDDAGVSDGDFSRAGVQSKKQNIPEVEIVFTNTEGDNYTAVAQVTGVVNPADAYYTWYIKNDEFDRTNKQPPLRPGVADNIDPNVPLEQLPSSYFYNRDELIPGAEYMGDWPYQGKDCTGGEFNGVEIKRCINFQMDRYKIAATRAHIATKFDLTRFDSEFNSPGGNGDFVVTNDEFPLVDNDLDNASVPNRADDPNTERDESLRVPIDDDNDGAIALVGGSDNYNGREKIVDGQLDSRGNGNADNDNYCYIYDNTSGVSYELVQSDTDSGFFCNGERVGTDDENWTVECLLSETFASCQAPGESINEVSVTTTIPDDPDTPEDESLENVASSSQTVPTPINKELISCERSPSDLICLYQPPSLQNGPGGSFSYCKNGGVPTCVPIADDTLGLQNQIVTANSCTGSRYYEILYEINEIREGTVTPTDPDTEANLLAELGEMVPDQDVNDAAIFDALLEDARTSTIDRNSFPCTTQVGDGNQLVPAIADEYGLVPPTCKIGPPNTPNKGTGELYSEESGLVNTCTESIHLAPFPFTDDVNKESLIEENPGFITGDGVFGRAEEKFWGTNPENAITFGENVNDEEFIIGKGLNEFTWKYEEGDEIGVVVEAQGLSSTLHDSQNPFVSFVFMKFGCEPQNLSYYTEIVRNKNVTFQTADMRRSDLNACLYENFAIPGDVQENNNLTVEIDAPEGTIINNQDFIIEFEATAGNESSSLTEGEITERSVFDWKIHYSPGEQDPNSQNIRWSRFVDYNLSQSDPELFAERMGMLELNELKAVGLSKLEMKANFDTEEGFEEGLIRATVEVNAPTDDPGVTIYGRAENIVSIASQTRPQLFMYRVNTDNLPIDTLEFNDLTRICDSVGARYEGDDLQSDGDNDESALTDRDTYIAEDIACRTFRNEILAFEIPDVDDLGSDIEPEQVSWEVNGERISCDTTLAPELCQQKPPIVFLPSVQRDGEIQTVTASTSNPGAGTAANETFSRSFVITPPKVVFEVVPGDDTIQAQELGSFIPTTGDEESAKDNVELSNTVFVRNQNTFQIKAKIDPPQLEDYAESATGSVAGTTDERVNVTWDWPGREGDQGVSNLIETITVPEPLVEKPVTVSARVTTSTPQPIRDLLLTKFNVDQYSTSPLTTEAEAIVHEPGYSTIAYLSDDQYRAYVKGNADRNKTFTATVFGNTASYLLFILKISLTIGLILFISSFAMGGVPVTDRRRRL